MRLLVLSLFLLSALFYSCKKKGCTDENAINYSSEAKKDDGSCEYAPQPKEGTLSLKVNSLMNGESLAYNKAFMMPDSSFLSFTLCRMYLGNAYIIGYEATNEDVDLSGNYLLIDPTKLSYELGKLKEGTYTGWQFTFGVDSLTNNTKQPTDFEVGHALGPQNPSMHWGWQQKYIFVKLEGLYDSNNDQVPDAVFQYHMGADQYARTITNYQNSQILIKSDVDNSTEITIDWAEFLKNFDIASSPKSHVTNSTSDTLMSKASNAFK
jgi:hypothetical protein